MAVLFSAAAQAQEFSTALPFVRIDRSAVTSAMGGVQGINSLYNPAAIPFTGSDVAISYQNWAPKGAKSTNLNLLGGVKIGRFGISATGAYQIGTEYENYDGAGNPAGTFKPSDFLVGLGVGFAITDYLSVGVNAKFAGSKLAADASYNAFAADAFVMYRIKGFKVSAGVASVGTQVKSGENAYSLPASAKLGLGYDMAFGKNGINLAADFDYFFNGGIGGGIGAQYGWNDMVFVRAGYHLGTAKAPIPSYASVGIGGKFFGVHLDVSFLLASQTVGNTLCIGLGYAF